MSSSPASSRDLKHITPACNLHSFLFSNPFQHSSPLVEILNAHTGQVSKTFPPIPPHRPIFYDPVSGTAVTYARLRRDTLRIAHGVHQRFGPPATTAACGCAARVGPVVLLHLPNATVWPVLALGFLAAGWTLTATDPGAAPRELAHVVAGCAPAVVVCRPGAAGEDAVRAVYVGKRAPEFFFVEEGEQPYGVCGDAPTRTSGRQSWTTLLSGDELEVAPMSADEADHRVALITWTSGTTGKPKGAMMSHRAIVFGMIQNGYGEHDFSDEERWIGAAPFYHIFALYLQVLFGTCIGATTIILPKFDLASFLRLISIHKATYLHLAPPLALALLNSPLVDEPWCTLRSVRCAITSGAPLAPEVVRALWERRGVVVKMAYGMSEAGPVTKVVGSGWEINERHLGSAGLPALGVKITVIGEDGKPVAANTPGELVVNSPAVMLGYLENPQATAETLDELGVHTGDLGYVDENGSVRITGRLKELIKYKGYQVSPNELEDLIATLPQVQDAAVSSVYSTAEASELPMVYIVPRGALDLAAAAAGVAAQTREHAAPPKELVALAEAVKRVVEENCLHYKRLRGGVVFVEAIPKSPSGKILRRLLKDLKGVHVQCYPLRSGTQSRL